MVAKHQQFQQVFCKHGVHTCFLVQQMYFKQVPGYERGLEPAVGGGVFISYFLAGLGVGSKLKIGREK